MDARIQRVNDVLKEYMDKMVLRTTHPEECMAILVEKGIYNGNWLKLQD